MVFGQPGSYLPQGTGPQDPLLNLSTLISFDVCLEGYWYT